MDDVQATSNEEVGVIIHSTEFDHHALLDWLDKFLFVGERKIFFPEPIREGEASSGLEKLRRASEEFLWIMIVRNRFDGPKQVKRLSKLNVISVNQLEADIQVRIDWLFL